jgi:hypothetical protein
MFESGWSGCGKGVLIIHDLTEAKEVTQHVG